MTYKEWLNIAIGLRSVYTSDRFLPDEDAIRVWYELLKDMPYEHVNVAAQKYMATEHFPPTPADLRKAILPQQEEWTDAWEKVIGAVRKYGSWDIKKAQETFDPMTAKLVKSFGGFERVCELEHGEMDVLRANFRDAYKTMQKREQEQAQLPPQIRGMIDQIFSSSAGALQERN